MVTPKYFQGYMKCIIKYDGEYYDSQLLKILIVNMHLKPSFAKIVSKKVYNLFSFYGICVKKGYTYIYLSDIDN